MIITRRHPLRFYFTLLLSSAFFFGMPIMLFWLSSTPEGQEDPIATMAMLLFAIVLFLLGIYTWYKYLKNVPIIKIQKDYIQFGSDIYMQEDVEYVDLWGKKDFPFLISHPMEAASIRFKDGTVRYMFGDLYTNSWEVKSYLETVFIKKETYHPPHRKATKDHLMSSGEFQAFKQPQLLTMRGISVWILPFIIMYLVSPEGAAPLGGMLAVAAFFIFWFILGSWFMHYPSLSKKELIIQNHNFFWKKHVYPLDQVKEVVFETQYRMPNCVRVIGTDHRNKLYPAGTLWDKDWWAFEEALEKKGIKVRNECVSRK